MLNTQKMEPIVGNSLNGLGTSMVKSARNTEGLDASMQGLRAIAQAFAAKHPDVEFKKISAMVKDIEDIRSAVATPTTRPTAQPTRVMVRKFNPSMHLKY